MMHDFWARRALLIERMQRSNDLLLTYRFLVNRTIIADPYTHLLQSGKRRRSLIISSRASPGSPA